MSEEDTYEKLISMMLILSVIVSLLAMPSFATRGNDTLELTFSGNTEYVKVGTEESEFYSYRNENVRIVEVTEANGITTVIEFDDITGEVYVNNHIVSMKHPVAHTIVAFAADNWGAEQEYVTSMEIANLGVSVIAAMIVGYYTGFNDVAMDIAQKAVDLALPVLWFKQIMQYNYVDYSPKVGYRHTEQIHSGQACNASTLMCTRTKTGTR